LLGSYQEYPTHGQKKKEFLIAALVKSCILFFIRNLLKLVNLAPGRRRNSNKTVQRALPKQVNNLLLGTLDLDFW
jgi:hypothetical protein